MKDIDLTIDVFLLTTVFGSGNLQISPKCHRYSDCGIKTFCPYCTDKFA